MACGSCGGKFTTAGPAAQVGGKTLYAVVTEGGKGRVAYQSHRLDLVRQVQERYVGSAIVPDPDSDPAQEAEVPESPAVVKRSRKSTGAIDAATGDDAVDPSDQ